MGLVECGHCGLMLETPQGEVLDAAEARGRCARCSRIVCGGCRSAAGQEIACSDCGRRFQACDLRPRPGPDGDWYQCNRCLIDSLT